MKRITKKKLSRNLKNKNHILKNILSHLLEPIGMSIRSIYKSINIYYHYKIKNNEKLRLAKKRYHLIISMRISKIKRNIINIIKASSIVTLILLLITFLNNIIDIKIYAEIIKDIAIYGILGFIIFFISYFGWILAKNMLLMIYTSKMNNRTNEQA
ncbi:MAG: hypothetical protein QXS02_05710 [Candidatus Thermoplasmatota archaeon]